MYFWKFYIYTGKRNYKGKFPEAHGVLGNMLGRPHRHFKRIFWRLFKEVE